MFQRHSSNHISFKTIKDGFIMLLSKDSALAKNGHMDVAMKVYTYMLMYNHIINAKKTYDITTKYDAVHIDFHNITVNKTHNVPVDYSYIVKCDEEDYAFNQYMIDKIFATHTEKDTKATPFTTHTSGQSGTPPLPEPLVINYIPMGYDIYNESMEPYGYCSQNLTLDFTPTQFRA